MKAYICCFMMSVAIIVGAWMHRDQDVSHKCENTARIENIEAAMDLLITASEDHAIKIETIAESLTDWNMAIHRLYPD